MFMNNKWRCQYYGTKNSQYNTEISQYTYDNTSAISPKPSLIAAIFEASAICNDGEIL